MNYIRCEVTGDVWDFSHPKYPYMMGQTKANPERYVLVEDIDPSENSQTPEWFAPIEVTNCNDDFCPMPTPGDSN